MHRGNSVGPGVRRPGRVLMRDERLPVPLEESMMWSLIAGVAFVVVWFVLMKFVLPRFGVPT